MTSLPRSRTFPKEAFASFEAAQPHFAPFVACIEQPIRRKCGERSWRLARAFASRRGDASCALDFRNASLWQDDTMETSQPVLLPVSFASSNCFRDK